MISTRLYDYRCLEVKEMVDLCDDYSKSVNEETWFYSFPYELMFLILEFCYFRDIYNFIFSNRKYYLFFMSSDVCPENVKNFWLEDYSLTNTKRLGLVRRWFYHSLFRHPEIEMKIRDIHPSRLFLKISRNLIYQLPRHARRETEKGKTIDERYMSGILNKKLDGIGNPFFTFLHTSTFNFTDQSSPSRSPKSTEYLCVLKRTEDYSSFEIEVRNCIDFNVVTVLSKRCFGDIRNGRFGKFVFEVNERRLLVLSTNTSFFNSTDSFEFSMRPWMKKNEVLEDIFGFLRIGLVELTFSKKLGPLSLVVLSTHRELTEGEIIYTLRCYILDFTEKKTIKVMRELDSITTERKNNEPLPPIFRDKEFLRISKLSLQYVVIKRGCVCFVDLSKKLKVFDYYKDKRFSMDTNDIKVSHLYPCYHSERFLVLLTLRNKHPQQQISIYDSKRQVFLKHFTFSSTRYISSQLFSSKKIFKYRKVSFKSFSFNRLGDLIIHCRSRENDEEGGDRRTNFGIAVLYKWERGFKKSKALYGDTPSVYSPNHGSIREEYLEKVVAEEDDINDVENIDIDDMNLRNFERESLVESMLVLRDGRILVLKDGRIGKSRCLAIDWKIERNRSREKESIDAKKRSLDGLQRRMMLMKKKELEKGNFYVPPFYQ